jgi:hypothetical protein
MKMPRKTRAMARQTACRVIWRGVSPLAAREERLKTMETPMRKTKDGMRRSCSEQPVQGTWEVWKRMKRQTGLSGKRRATSSRRRSS